MKSKQDTIKLANEWYILNRPIYKTLANKIENIISEILDINTLSYHIITSRSKTIESFKEKINNEKYDDPINQITDLAGIRIITYVEDEVRDVCKLITETFEIDKENSSDKGLELGIDKVGYKSVHYIAKLKNERLLLPEYQSFKDRYFEIQVRTILQHAWAEIEHDRNYKFSGKLPDEITRRFKLLAGLLEISDREFNNIAKEIDNTSKKVEEGTKSGNLNFKINSTSLKQYLETKFKSIENTFTIQYNITETLIEELEKYGIKTLEELDKIIPDDLIDQLIKNKELLGNTLRGNGILRFIMIINDSKKYFSKSWNKGWKVWSVGQDFDKLSKYYKIDWDKIEKDYGVKSSN